MNVSEWMTREVGTVGPNDLLSTARDRMLACRCHHLPVADTWGHLIGIVTERDLREHSAYLANTRVSAAMVTELVTTTPDTSVARAAVQMVEHQIGSLPVLARNGQMVGLVTRTDLLRALVRVLHHDREEQERSTPEFTPAN